MAAAADHESFYLAGGTAVALHLGHRRSIDFDWFSARALLDPASLAARLRERGVQMTVRALDRGTLHAGIEDVAVSFLEYLYPLLEPPVPWPEMGCTVASLAHLACMKLSAVASRGSRKDFVDVFALGHSGFPLERMLELYTTKYSVPDIAHVLTSLSYFDDAERETMPDMIWPLDWPDVRATIERWVRAAT